MRYRLGQFCLESNLDFPELALSDLPEADIKIKLLEGLPKPEAYRWLHHWYASDGSPFLSLSRLPDWYVIRARESADFHLNIQENEILCRAYFDSPLDTMRHLILDQIIPFLLHAKGYLVFHASAVRWNNKAIGFLGDSGSGKSTLATYLTQRGLKLVTDDCLHLEDNGTGVICYPYYDNLRLWPDSLMHLVSPLSNALPVSHYNNKKRVSPHEAFDYSPVPLETLLLLNREKDWHTNDIRIERLSPRDAFMALTRYMFRLDVTDMDKITRDMDRIARLVEKLEFYFLSFPREWDQLPRVQEKITALFESS